MAVLRSDFLTQGPVVPKFEAVVAEYCGARFGVAVNSATSALHVACLALGVGPGDRVWTSPITFVASANCALYCGAMVDFVDIDPNTWNLSTSRLEEMLVEAERSGKLPKVVIPVHLAGEPCDMVAIHALGQRYGFRIIEDASHAIGASYRGERVGSCRWSDVTVFSFHPVKIVTTAEGGMAMTNDEGLARRMARLRTHGITREPEEMVYDSAGPWYYEQIELGFNYRLTDVHAALGLAQMQRLHEFVTRRHVIAAEYDKLLAELPLIRPHRDPANQSALHLYQVLVEGRDIVFRDLRALGVGVNVHYIPVYRQPWHIQSGSFSPCPAAEHYYERSLSLPIFPDLTAPEQEHVARSVADALSQHD